MNILNKQLKYGSKNQGVIFITCLLFVVVVSGAIIQLIFHISEHKKQYREIHQSLDNRLFRESSIYHSLNNIPHILKNITLEQPYTINIESPFIFQTNRDHITKLQENSSAKILAKKLFTNSSQRQGYSSNVFNSQSYQLFIDSSNNISNSMEKSANKLNGNFLTTNCLTVNSDYQDQSLFNDKTLHTISTNPTSKQDDINVFRYKTILLNSADNASFVRQSVIDNFISAQYTIAPSFTLIKNSYDIFSSTTNDDITVHALFFAHTNDKLYLIIINDHINHHQANNQTINKLFDVSASPQELTIQYSNTNNVILLNTGLYITNINLDSLKSVTFNHKQFIFIDQKNPQTNDNVLIIDYHPSTYSLVVKNQAIVSNNVKAKVEVKAKSPTLSTPLSLMINDTEIFNGENNQCTVTSIY